MYSTYISKDDSNAIKGIAILLMLFYHLFNRVTDGVVDVWVGGQPLTKFLSGGAYPVPFFLMMSGYGLYYTKEKGRLNLGSTCKRSLKLYIHYWLVLLIFAGIGCFVAPEFYPGDAAKVIENVTAWHCTYNYETWFLLPYVVLSLLAPLIFRTMDKIPIKWSLLMALVISYGAQFVVSRYVATGALTQSVLVFVIVVAGLLFDFVIGAAMAKYTFAHQRENGGENQHPISLSLGILLLVVLFLLRCVIRLPWDTIYTFLLVFIFLNMKRIGWVEGILRALGKKSMVMWMVHTYFSIYLFHDFIYSFKYPILIYFVLIIISYCVSLLLGMFVSFIYRRMKYE